MVQDVKFVILVSKDALLLDHKKYDKLPILIRHNCGKHKNTVGYCWFK